MTRTRMKRNMAMLLVLALMMSLFSAVWMPVHAAGETGTSYLISYPRAGDANAVYTTSAWGHPTKHFMNGWISDEVTVLNVHCMDSFYGKVCYCIEPGIARNIGDSYMIFGEDFWNNYPSTYNKTIQPAEIKSLIGRIMQYGYQGDIDANWKSQNAADADKFAHIIATQLLIWETVVGERDAAFNHVSTSGYDTVKSTVSGGHPLYSRIMAYYDSMEASVKGHTVIPSFMAMNSANAQTVELSWDGSKYSAVLTDANSVLDKFSFKADRTGFDFSVSGNKLTVSTTAAPSAPVTITATRNNTRSGVVVWSDGVIGPNGGVQDTVVYSATVGDPVNVYLKINVSYGSAKIIKTSEDGVVSGITFTITGDGVNKTVTTNSRGEVQIDNLMPGTYTVTEQGYDRYVPQESHRVTVVSGQTATVSFNNVLRRGVLVVTKTAEDGLLEGVKFHLYGTSASGIEVNEYATTGADGKAHFEAVLIGSGYTLEEVNTPERYVIPDKQTCAIEWNTVTNKSFSNTLKKFNVTVTKTDAETGAVQGGGSLAGAVYGIYKEHQLVDTYVTDENGQFTTNYYPCGDTWSIGEISPSEGYLMDDTFYQIGAEAKNYRVEYNSAPSVIAYETAIHGRISIVKHCDNGDTQIETPEEGAMFQVYLKSAGSYGGCKVSERDQLTCDANGFAETKLLPYGIYTVHQISGWEGREMMKDFDVFIAEDNQVYRFILNDAYFASFIKVIKTDAETGKTIPYAGAGFKILNPNGEPVSMQYTYPTITTVDTFYTDASGMLITPCKLPYGNGYSLIEVTAPYGYIVNSDPVRFNVTHDNSSEEGGVTVIEVKKADYAQKGVINISKSGEVFASVTENGGIYQPVYEVQGLPGAVYEIRAAENITTPDGTIRAEANTIVDTVTTDASGVAKSCELYLGKYEIRETKAPEGMILNENTLVAELTYAGQEVSVTDTSASFTNERQKVVVSIGKVMEQNKQYNIGMNDELFAVNFGLYAAKNLAAADGSKIPVDGLIEIVSVNENGKAVAASDLPFGSYYLKETATDSHYIPNKDKYEFTFRYAGQETELVEIKANDGEPVVNELIYGSVKGMKVDENKNPVAGAEIGLFFLNSTEPIATVTSCENGSFEFKDVPYGEYVVKEIKAPAGYLLNTTEYPVVIDAVGVCIEIEMEDETIRGNVELTKVDANYPDHHLAGARFEVYKDGELVGAMEELADGVYRMDDLAYGTYTLRETVAPAGFYHDSNTYAFGISEHGKTVIVENEAGKGFINNAQTGSLRIEKRSEDGVLKGFTFRVEGTDITGNTYIQEFTTNDKGEILIEGLRIGDYTVSEVANKANEKYTLPAAVTVTVHEGKTVVAKFYNELKPVVPDIPKTGEVLKQSAWYGALVVFTMASAVVMGYTISDKIKEKRVKGKHEK